MSLLVKDSLSGKMVEVGESGGLSLYICGPTVYDHIHVGNARATLFWDVVARYLRSRFYDVTFVQNITDMEDKIINEANQEGVSWQEIVDRYTDSFHERLEMLGIGLPDVEPRATEHIPEMISLIEELIEKGHAYAPEEARGDVYYAVDSFPPYGALSHQRPEEMRETEKGQTGFKRSPLDFALWKASKPGEPSWESPWGPGRPGWHISARRWSRSTCPPARTCTAAAPTSSSRTTRTSWPRAAELTLTTPSSAPGSTTAWSTSSGTRWPSPSATSWTSRRPWSATAVTLSGCGSCRATTRSP